MLIVFLAVEKSIKTGIRHLGSAKFKEADTTNDKVTKIIRSTGLWTTLKAAHKFCKDGINGQCDPKFGTFSGFP